MPSTVTRRTAPLAPRRVSGPVRRPVPVGPSSRTGAFERLARIPDHFLVDRLLRSRLCIWVIGIMLGGIVFMQVSLLRMNTGISRAVAAQSTLERQNTTLRAFLAERSSGDLIRDGAAKDGMIDPQAGDTRYLTARESDVERAVKRWTRPSQSAIWTMEHNGQPMPSVTPGAVTSTAAVGGVTATPTPQATPTPVPTVNALPTPGATPVPTTVTG
jgi:hypothetical protein